MDERPGGLHEIESGSTATPRTLEDGADPAHSRLRPDDFDPDLPEIDFTTLAEAA